MVVSIVALNFMTVGKFHSFALGITNKCGYWNHQWISQNTSFHHMMGLEMVHKHQNGWDQILSWNGN
jgi:hypothetical protein